MYNIIIAWLGQTLSDDLSCRPRGGRLFYMFFSGTQLFVAIEIKSPQ